MEFRWFFFLLLPSWSLITNILCNPSWCPQSSKGDGICDPNCMVSFCNFDSNFTTNPKLNPENSDCYQLCIDNYNCSPSSLGNGICDENCNNSICGYDLGDCGYCSSNCKLYLGYQDNLSKSCIESCNNQNCYYGLGACQDCSPGCSNQMLGDEICDKSCNVMLCNYDFGDCNSNKCNPDCELWMIGDNNCNEECNTLPCNWDSGDCDCSQGCHSYMKGSGICEAACDNLACDYDGGDCQKCVPGCLYSMLGDGVCNSACNINDCHYDNYDCGCAEGCGIESYGQCKDSCMNSFCRYDTISSASMCQDTNLILFALHYGFIFKNLAINVSPDNCTSTTSCLSTEVLDSSSCHTNCDNSNCINSWSMCENNACTDSNCLVCNSNNLGDCFKCSSNTYQFYGYCLTECPGGHEPFILLENYPVCLLPVDYSTKDNPTIYYVTALTSTDIYDGNGTLSNPFTSLSLALASIYSKYSIIYLFNDGDHYLTCISTANPVNTLLDDVCDPLNRSFNLKNLLISSYDNTTITIKTKPDNNFPVFTIRNSTIVTLKNIVFIGKDILSDCPSSESPYCSYCPNATLESDGYYYSDQGIKLTSFLNASTCSTYHSKTLFNMHLNSKLVLQNVNFTEWRMELKSIITSYGGIITFSDVNFDNIRCFWENELEPQGIAVIYFDDCGDPNYNCGSFEYTNGVVSRLNNGYEYGSAEFSGFLAADKIRTVKLKNVTFINNIVYNPDIDSINYSLIKISVYRSIEISHCVFDKNIAYYGLIYLSPTTLVFRNDVNSNKELIDLLLYHVYIHDTTFKNNYGENSGILSAFYHSQLQRILLENLIIDRNAVFYRNSIYIKNDYNSSQYLTDTKTTINDANGNLVKATFKKRDFIFKDSIITHNNSGLYVFFYITWLFNTRIKNLTVESNGLETQNINKILWSYYVADSDLYTKKLVDSPNDFDCFMIWTGYYLYNHELLECKFINNFCKDNSPAIVYSNLHNANFTDITFEGNRGHSWVKCCIYSDTSWNLRITNSKFNNNTNSDTNGPGALIFHSSYGAYIENTIISNNSASFRPGIWFVGTSLFLNNVTIESNSASSGNGVISFSCYGEESQVLEIKNSAFKDNISFNDSGGAIYISCFSYSRNEIILNVKNNYFISNWASDGSVIYIDRGVTLSNDSIIESCIFMHNIAESIGTIVNLNRHGILSISNSLFAENYAELGSAIYYTNSEESSPEKSKLILTSCNFTGNSGKSVLSIDDIAIYSYIQTINCIFQNNEGIAISLVHGNWKDTESIIANTTTAGGAVYLTSNTTANCELTSFANNTSIEYAGAVKAKGDSYFHCDRCSFDQNSAKDGGVLYFYQLSYFSIENSYFSNNFCGDKGAAIYIMRSAGYSVLKNSKFFNNYAESEGLIYSILSNIIIDNCEIYDNSANKTTPGIYLALSNATVSNSQFHDQKGNYGSFLYLDSHTILIVKNSSFINGMSYTSGGSIYALSSYLFLEDTDFEYSISNTGNAIFAFSTALNISKCRFLNAYSTDSGGVITASGSDIFIEKSFFENFNNSAIDCSEIVSLSVIETSFKNSLSKVGGVISCTNTYCVYIDSCDFQNNTSLYGGALYFTFTSSTINSQPYEVISTEFLNNTSSAGGAIFVDNINIDIESCGFYNNKALDTFEISQDIHNSGIGGALKLGCSNSELCSFNITSNDFEGNSADWEGGALIWREVMPHFESNSFKNNKAEYGENIASYPISMKVLNSNWTGVLNDLASGQLTTTPLIIGLIDHLGEIVATENTFLGELVSLSKDVALSHDLKVKAINGTFSFSSFIISAKPGSSFSLEIQTNGIDPTKNSKANDGLTYNSSIFVNVTLRDCKLGEATVGVNCVICAKDFYSLNPKNEQCLACPDEAICYGNYTMVPKPGYWRSDMLSEKFWTCPNSKACIGSDPQNISYTGNCDKGYTGNLCQSCSEGYYKLIKNQCEKCQSLSIVIIKMSGIILGFLILWWIMVRMSKNFAYKPRSLTSVYTKILINYMQLIALTTTFNLSWPSYLKDLFSIQNNASFISDLIFSFDCLLYYSKNLGGDTAIFYQKLFVIAILPLLIPFIAGFSWSLVSFCKRNNALLFDNIVTSSIIAAFLVHPSLIKYYFSSFDCTELDHGKEWLVLDLNIRCWDIDHLFFITTISLPAIFLWGIGIPAICLFLIMKNKKNLSNISVRIKYGFLFNGYKPTSCYWEFVIIYRKIAIICCTVFLATVSVNIQALTALFVLIACLYLQQKIKPYNEDHLNRLEAISISTSAITIYCGLYFLTGALDQTTELIFFIAIILANSYFMIYWIIKAGNAYIAMIIKKIPFLKRNFYSQSGKILTGVSLRKNKTGRIGEIVPETSYYHGENLNPQGINFKEITMKLLLLKKLKRKMILSQEEIEQCSFEENNIEEKSIDEDNIKEPDMENSNFEEKYLKESKADISNYLKVAEIETIMEIEEEKREMNEIIIINPF